MLLQPQIREKRHSLTVRVNQVQHQNILTDELRLSQILINLVGNAVKYTPEGGKISLVITEKGEEEDGRVWLEFVISDNGIGMSQEFLPKLFEVFTQEDAGARTQARGSGLGMAIVQNLVAMMQGTIPASILLISSTSLINWRRYADAISILTRHSFAFAVFPIFSSAIAVIPIIPFIGVRIS